MSPNNKIIDPVNEFPVIDKLLSNLIPDQNERDYFLN